MSDEHDDWPVYQLDDPDPLRDPGAEPPLFDESDGRPPTGGPPAAPAPVAPPPTAPFAPVSAPPVSPPPPAPPPLAFPAPAAGPAVEPEPRDDLLPDTADADGKPPAAEAEAAPDDPFQEWPQPASQALIEEESEEGVSVEHVEGEIEVPDGYTVLEGSPTGHRRAVGLVVSRFNGGLTNRMLARAIEALEEAGVSAASVTVVPVPGAFELPLAAMALAKTRRYACIVALGAIVRGETPHFDYIASESASGLQLAGLETGVPVAFGVLTVETIEQAEARVERAADAVRTALEMADLFARLRASARAVG